MPRAQGTPVVLVFGESINDSRSVAELIRAANPSLKVTHRPRPTSLTRNAGPKPVHKWVTDLAGVVRATEAAGTPVRAVVVHQDSDGPDPQGLTEQQLADRLRALTPSLAGRPAVPVQMLEAWWLLFPDAVESVRPVVWRNKLPRKPRDVETVANPKQELVRLTSRSGCPQYSEADSEPIARFIREQSPPACGTSASYRRFVAMVRRL